MYCRLPPRARLARGAALAAIGFIAACHQELEIPAEALCHPETLGEDADTEILAAYRIDEGRLASLCLGRANETLQQAFANLNAIARPDQLADLGVFAAFRWLGDDEITVAYVLELDDAGEQFVMAINLDEFEADPASSTLTLAHEFAHVLTRVPEELDRGKSAEACETFWTGDGCFQPDSLMWRWVQAFWSPEAVATIDPDAEVYVEDGEARCALDSAFFGPYAASHPEEDFAESYSAYVLGVVAQSAGQQKKLDWMAAEASIAAQRQRALERGLPRLVDVFDQCGPE